MLYHSRRLFFSHWAAERILSHVKKYVEEKLFLKVNETKTKIVRAGNARTFLEIIGLSHPAVSDQAKKCADGQPY